MQLTERAATRPTTPKPREFDACVFGAGPAALSVAGRLLKLGRDVAVLERPSTLRSWGGESFSGAIRGPLISLDLWDAFADAGHVRGYERQVAWGGEPVCESSLVRAEGYMWHVDRDRFDADLRAEVGRRGAVLRSYQQLQTIVRQRGGWRLTLDEGVELTARYLVDATGRSRSLAKRFGAHTIFYDRLVGLTSEVAHDRAPFGVVSLIIQAEPFGWWYAAPVPRGHIVSLFTDVDLAPPEVRQRLRPVAANSAFTEVPEDEGWLAVGDACASHDPLCGWGVHRALANGIRAADAIDAHLRDRDFSALADYRAYCRNQFDAYLEGLRQHYSIERRWAGAPFWMRRADGSAAGERI